MQTFWDYIRLRTRDSALAGLQEAIDIIEGDGSNQQQEQAAAHRYLERHGRKGELVPAPGRTPVEAPEADAPQDLEPAHVVAEPATIIRPPDASKPAERTTLAARISVQMRGDAQPLDPFEQRLQQTNPTLNPTPEPAFDPTARRKRGRPRKNP